ncbi:MAG TPA: DbpA RNA binding domain-containing protein, partial [Polyangia bacterium]|nr:DbpA RNA binding domain-containing protein [Polyangia bacterium]
GERGFRPEPGPARAPAPPPEREFWEVWSEEKAAQAAAEAGAPAESVAAGAFPPGSATPTPPESAGDESVARLYLNLGRKDGASEQEVQNLLASHVGAGVLSLDVMNTHTYINVPAADADRICATLTGKELGGRELICERAKPRRR